MELPRLFVGCCVFVKGRSQEGHPTRNCLSIPGPAPAMQLSTDRYPTSKPAGVNDE